jgi:hypothetical protein
MVARRGRSAGVLRPWHAGSEASKPLGGPISSWDTREAEEYCPRESPPDADEASYHAAYSGRGKATYRGKDVTAGRRPHRTRLPDTVGAEPQQATFLRGIAHTARVDTPHRLRDLSRCLEADLWLDGWHDLKKAAARGVAQRTAAA